MNIFFATDHAGFALKETLIPFVRDELGYVVEDCGAHTLVSDDDYPDYTTKAAKAVSENPDATRAIVLGGSGEGEAIVANRFPHVRAVVVNSHNTELVKLTREHNDSNVLSLGARFISEGEAKNIVKTWLETNFSEDERHVRRIRKIDSL